MTDPWFQWTANVMGWHRPPRPHQAPTVEQRHAQQIAVERARDERDARTYEFRMVDGRLTQKPKGAA